MVRNSSLRSASRGYNYPSTRDYTVGFRLSFQQIEEADQVRPELELFGGTDIPHELGEPWAEPGFFASDERDGNLTSSVTISGTVDVQNVGTYILTYSVSDNAGNEANTSRMVRVVNQLIELNSTSPLSVAENQQVGSLVGELNATHEGDLTVIFQMVSGEGDVDNTLFDLSEDGVLTTSALLDFEESSIRSIRVLAKDQNDASVEQQFSISILDLDDEKPVLALNGDANITHEAGDDICGCQCKLVGQCG